MSSMKTSEEQFLASLHPSLLASSVHAMPDSGIWLPSSTGFEPECALGELDCAYMDSTSVLTSMALASEEYIGIPSSEPPCPADYADVILNCMANENVVSSQYPDYETSAVAAAANAINAAHDQQIYWNALWEMQGLNNPEVDLQKLSQEACITTINPSLLVTECIVEESLVRPDFEATGIVNWDSLYCGTDAAVTQYEAVKPAVDPALMESPAADLGGEPNPSLGASVCGIDPALLNLQLNIDPVLLSPTTQSKLNMYNTAPPSRSQSPSPESPLLAPLDAFDDVKPVRKPAKPCQQSKTIRDSRAAVPTWAEFSERRGKCAFVNFRVNAQPRGSVSRPRGPRKKRDSISGLPSIDL